MNRLFAFSTFALITLCAPAAAQVPMTGVFTAEATCAATPSISDPTRNPGNVATEAGRTYELVGRNAVPGSHYLILVPGAEPEQRWVAYGCGRVEQGTQFGATGEGPEADRPTWVASMPFARAPRDEYVLAVNWQPAFCETRPRVPECRAGGRDDGGFSLHGLWPQPRGRDYCGVPARIVSLDEAGDWRALPDVTLTAGTRGRLARAMPGVASGLDRHEWWKHGSCFEGDAEAYFSLSLRLLDALNASEVRERFEDAIGMELSSSEVRAAFDGAFGDGAGRNVHLECDEVDGRVLLVELRIGLAGDLRDSFADMIHAGEPANGGCNAGEVDAQGFARG